MEHYAGIDVSLEASSVCVVDGSGRIVREAKVASEPEALLGWFFGRTLLGKALLVRGDSHAAREEFARVVALHGDFETQARGLIAELDRLGR